MTQRTVSAVCFDLFETLITEYIADFQPAPTIAEQLQIAPDQFARAWAARIPARFRGELADFPAVLNEICAECGIQARATLIAELNEARLREKARPFAHVDPRILEMLAAIRGRGIKLGLISNASSEEVAAWQGCTLAPYFDVATFSFQVGSIKPEPEIYWRASESLGIAPDAVLFVGDGGSHELMGAQRAGLHPYWATWFLDQWPFARQSAEQQRENEQFIRLQTPVELLNLLDVEYLLQRRE